jgi:hypothetical protein
VGSASRGCEGARSCHLSPSVSLCACWWMKTLDRPRGENLLTNPRILPPAQSASRWRRGVEAGAVGDGLARGGSVAAATGGDGRGWIRVGDDRRRWARPETDRRGAAALSEEPRRRRLASCAERRGISSDCKSTKRRSAAACCSPRPLRLPATNHDTRGRLERWPSCRKMLRLRQSSPPPPRPALLIPPLVSEPLQLVDPLSLSPSSLAPPGGGRCRLAKFLLPFVRTGDSESPS